MLTIPSLRGCDCSASPAVEAEPLRQRGGRRQGRVAANRFLRLVSPAHYKSLNLSLVIG